MKPWALLSLVLPACACVGTGHGDGTGACHSNSDCLSDRCSEGQCLCGSAADCPSGQTCGAANCPPGISCGGATVCFAPYLGDSGCYANHLVSGVSCPSGTTCDQGDGNCHPSSPPVLPICGQSDPSYGYDAGWGPGPSAGGACGSCIGCPMGTECVCGVSGLGAGLSCGPANTNAGAALACFLTGVLGDCQIFPGDCASNAQCTATPQTPYCSQSGSCIQCLRDDQCPQDAGAQGCFDGRCGACCTADDQCPDAAPLCEQGFCYAQCRSAADCATADAGAYCCGPLCQSIPCDAGTPDAGDGGHIDGGSTDGG